MFGNKYKMVLVKKTGNDETPNYEAIKTLNISARGHAKIYKGQEYTYSLKEISYHKGRTHFIFKDIETGDAELQFGRTITAAAPDDISEKREKSLINAAIHAAESPYGTVVLILALVAGLGVGFVVAVLAYPKMFPDMVKHTTTAAKMIGGLLH